MISSRKAQASIEAVCGIAFLIIASLICLQLLAAGYTRTLVDGAAEAGAVALVTGRPVEPAVKSALPGWASSQVSILRFGESIRVKVRPPSLFDAVARRLESSSTVTVKSG